MKKLIFLFLLNYCILICFLSGHSPKSPIEPVGVVIIPGTISEQHFPLAPYEPITIDTKKAFFMSQQIFLSSLQKSLKNEVLYKAVSKETAVLIMCSASTTSAYVQNLLEHTSSLQGLTSSYSKDVLDIIEQAQRNKLITMTAALSMMSLYNSEKENQQLKKNKESTCCCSVQ